MTTKRKTGNIDENTQTDKFSPKQSTITGGIQPPVEFARKSFTDGNLPSVQTIYFPVVILQNGGKFWHLKNLRRT